MLLPGSWPKYGLTVIAGMLVALSRLLGFRLVSSWQLVLFSSFSAQSLPWFALMPTRPSNSPNNRLLERKPHCAVVLGSERIVLTCRLNRPSVS